MEHLTTYTASQLRDNLSEVIDKAIYHGPVLVKRHRHTVAVISADLLNLLTELEALVDSAKAQEALDEYNKKGGTPLHKIKQELGIP